MRRTEKQMTLLRPLPAVVATLVFAWLGVFLFAQQSTRGTISGVVTADQGEVRAFRVAAHNLDLRLWYVVFTSNGTFTVPQALPGQYELEVLEPGYVSARMLVRLAPGGSETVNLSLKSESVAERPDSVGGDEGPASNVSSRNIVYVDSMEEIFPPGPGQELVREHCVGCHRDGGSWRGARTYDDFLRGIEQMTETGPANNPYALALGRTPIGAREKAVMAEYLANNVGTSDRRLRVDPLVLDEDVASKSIYVLYDLPEDLPKQPSTGNVIGADMIEGVIAQSPAPSLHHLQASAISPVDGRIWFSNRVSNAVLRLDPKERDPARRWTNYPIKGNPWVAVSGITVDSKGKVYWSELQGGRMGELDPVIQGAEYMGPDPANWS